MGCRALREARALAVEVVARRAIAVAAATTSGNHLRVTFTRPDGLSRFVILPATPGDHRARLNSRADMRRAIAALLSETF